MKRFNQKGFTLAELLIVVAIIAVLVAIAIPIFNTQLEKSRDVTTIANVRSAYAEAQASYLSEVTSDTNVTINKTGGKITSIVVANVKFQGVQSGWNNAKDDLPLGVTWTALTDELGGDKGTKALTFTYGDDGSITLSVA